MKKIFLIAGITLSVFLFVYCKPSGKNQQSTSDQPETSDSIYASRHSETDSLNYEGVYTGILPCADCDGIDTEIAVNKDNTYVKRSRYIGKDNNVLGNKGTYTWNTEHNTITLSGVKDGPNQYLVGPNTLTQLDMSGKKISGPTAAKYVLKK